MKALLISPPPSAHLGGPAAGRYHNLKRCCILASWGPDVAFQAGMVIRRVFAPVCNWIAIGLRTEGYRLNPVGRT